MSLCDWLMHMSELSSNSLIEKLTNDLFHELLTLHGPMMTGIPLYQALGYQTSDSFRQAIYKQTIPITVFSISKRRGKFALTKDVATWIALQRCDQTCVSIKEE
ncbi:hypothetical protein ND2E_3912 [Colwellia psychrerythraea]|uniref:Pyocin activator protein PrtN n=2 Tax=Colwellia psychrerythraea TaxID=28229 RepID=A0A099KD38_COLPS|nr:hypothetical protein ND2E_3912 [Colwellia psychrerythraea]